MKKNILVLFLIFSINSNAQNKIEKLLYGKTSIAVPDNCSAESESNITDCNGFSAMWYYIESSGNAYRKKTIKQIEENIKFTTKREIKFNSQNQLFEGMLYQMIDGTFRYVGFGKINEIPTMIIIGLKEEIKENTKLNDFERNFITLIQQ